MQIPPSTSPVDFSYWRITMSSDQTLPIFKTEHQPKNDPASVKFWEEGYYSPWPASKDTKYHLHFSEAKTEQTIGEVKQSIDEATRLLGRLHLNVDSGVSRADILKAEAKPGLSKDDKHLLDALLSLAPDANQVWNTADHDRHRIDLREAKGSKEASVLLHKGSSAQQDKAVRDAQKTFDGDMPKQFDAYMNSRTINASSLQNLKHVVAEGRLAARIIAEPGKPVDSLMMALHIGKNGSLSPEVATQALADKLPGVHLTAEQRDLLTVIHQGQVQKADPAFQDSTSADSPIPPRPYPRRS